jgi:hypothetical protein
MYNYELNFYNVIFDLTFYTYLLNLQKMESVLTAQYKTFPLDFKPEVREDEVDKRTNRQATRSHFPSVRVSANTATSLYNQSLQNKKLFIYKRIKV